jgi:hypothetical protein
VGWGANRSRALEATQAWAAAESQIMKIIVVHQLYGCDTGCCGHVVEVDGQQVGRFDFGHPTSLKDTDVQAYVRDLVTEQYGAEHVADIDWDHCLVEE